jgi:glycosyltransferase involved in cell wall biosynthesis
MDRVLFAVNAQEFGGLEVVLLDWLSGIDYSKVSVAVAYRSEVLKEKLTALALPAETIKLAFPTDESAWKEFQNWRRIFREARPNKIILMEGNVGDLSLAPILAARLSTTDTYLFAGGGGATVEPANPSIATKKSPLGLYRLKQSIKQKFRSTLLRRNFVPSQALKDNVVSNLSYRADKTTVLYHGVDTTRFQPSPASRKEFRRAESIPEDATVIASHGRIAPIKRVDRILKAFATVSPENPNLWLLLTNYGPLKEEIEKTVSSSNVSSQVKLLGFQQDSSDLLKSADIYILASDREGFGIALVEAMSTGLLCIATNCQGPAEILANDENGFLVAPTDEGVLAGLKKALNATQQEKAKLTTAARKSAQTRFEIQVAVRQALKSMGIPSR